MLYVRNIQDSGDEHYEEQRNTPKNRGERNKGQDKLIVLRANAELQTQHNNS